MSDVTERFFAEIERRGPGLLPRKYSGSIRFDLSRDRVSERWVVLIESGDVRVSREDRDADCLIRARDDLFARVLTGQQGVFAAVLRNVFAIEGELTLITPLRELLAAVPSTSEPGEREPEAE